MTTQTAGPRKSHRRAVRFFWAFLLGATTISLVGNVAHALLPLLPHIAIQVGAAAVPPIALLAAVHGIALSVRAGASGRIYWLAVVAVGFIGMGAFAVSFLTLRDLMHAIGYSTATAWIFPAIIDATVAVSTMMLVALGDRPPRRSRAAGASTSASGVQKQSTRKASAESATPQVSRPLFPRGQASRAQDKEGQASGPVGPASAHTTVDSAQPATGQLHFDLASDLRSTGVTTQPVETVIAVLAARRGGATINAAAKACGVNYRTAQRIVQAAAARQERQLAATG